MPPKEKGGKKKGKKTERKITDIYQQLTTREAILAFQTEIKERDLEKLTEEYRVLKEKNRKLRFRNELLEKEKDDHIKMLLKQSKSSEKEVEQITVVQQEEVEKAIADKLYTIKKLISEEEELKAKNRSLKSELTETKRIASIRNDYKMNGQVVNSNEINVLKKKLSNMEMSVQEVSTHLNHSLKIAKEEIVQQAEAMLTDQKRLASEEAVNSIKKDDRQEFTDYQWLKKEISIHKRAVEDMSLIVENLEQENLEIMKELFDCKLKDVNFARSFYLSSVNQEYDSNEEEIFSQHGVISDTQDGEQNEDNLLDNYLIVDEDSNLDSCRLGPLELPLLSVVGKKLPVHEARESQLHIMTSEGQDLSKTTDSDNEFWPISHNMLRTLAIK